MAIPGYRRKIFGKIGPGEPLRRRS